MLEDAEDEDEMMDDSTDVDGEDGDDDEGLDEDGEWHGIGDLLDTSLVAQLLGTSKF